jgi:hypothetical protein
MAPCTMYITHVITISQSITWGVPCYVCSSIFSSTISALVSITMLSFLVLYQQILCSRLLESGIQNAFLLIKIGSWLRKVMHQLYSPCVLYHVQVCN